MTWLDFIGWSGSALLIYSLMQARVLRFRVLNLLACLILVIFNGLLGIWPMVVMNVVLSVINAFFIKQLVGGRHSEESYKVLQVGANDEYLRHVLRVHSRDILRHQPDFLWDCATPGHMAFLIQKGDETVGVVLGHEDPPGVLQVELDYVTPRFRDFSPGEFVWRRSSLLSDAGLRQVVTPAAMVAPYYEKLGFRPAGDAFVLDV